jgi:muramoyltetrapeptide carboxypeptidase
MKAKQATRIGVVAPASRFVPELADRLSALAASLYPADAPQLRIHPQCFLSSGHFAGTDAQRAAAFLEYASDESLDAVWFARGGYGSCRIADALEHLTRAARRKTYLGYSDAGFLLGGLYRRGCPVAHGPMPADLSRPGGEAAVARALRFLVERAPDTLEPSVAKGGKTAAFNITVLSQMLGTALEPDLCGHVLMLEEVSEYMYRIDRSLFHIVSHPAIRKVRGILLGRCSDIPSNDPDFGEDEEAVVRRWCAGMRIPYLGRADIGHDSANKVVPFGTWRG